MRFDLFMSLCPLPVRGFCVLRPTQYRENKGGGLRLLRWPPGMQGIRQAEYPAIAKAQRLTAERLGSVARNQQQCGSDEQQRPFAESQKQQRNSGAAADPTIPTASIVQQEPGGGAPSSSSSTSTWMWDASTTRATVRDHRHNRDMASARVGLLQQQGGRRRAQTADNEKNHDPPGGKPQTCRTRKAPFPYQRAPNACRREVECLWSEGESSEASASASSSSSGSQSPPPPLPPPRLGVAVAVERVRSSPERCLLDVGQVCDITWFGYGFFTT